MISRIFPGSNLSSQDCEVAGEGVLVHGQSKVITQVRSCVLFAGQTAGLQFVQLHSSAVHFALKAAVTVLSTSIVRLQVPVPLQPPPDHPTNIDAGSAIADKISESP